MNTKKIYVLTQDNTYYEYKSEREFYDKFKTFVSLEEIGLNLNDVFAEVWYGDNTIFHYKVSYVVYDYQWRVINKERIIEICEKINKEREEKRLRWYYNRYPNMKFRFDSVPGTGNRYHGCRFRKPKTTQERRKSFSCHEKYVRTKRNYIGLPNTWDDVYRAGAYKNKVSWKQNKKRKQWM